jgi:hypothetical protein
MLDAIVGDAWRTELARTVVLPYVNKYMEKNNGIASFANKHFIFFTRGPHVGIYFSWLPMLQLKNITKNRSLSKMMASRRCDRLVSHRSNNLRCQLLCLLSTQRLTQRHALIVLLAYRLLNSLEKPSDELFTSEKSATLYGSN